MLRTTLRAVLLVIITSLLVRFTPPAQTAAQDAPAGLAATPVFRFPVVPGSTTSGYFDHNRNDNIITFYNGRHNDAGNGFYFQCSNPAMYDWVGCEDAVAGEPGCANNRELWYDEHHGTDYEYSSNWHTGAYCDPGRFSGITMPVYSPARGQVLMAGYDPNRPANGWHIRLKHDLNGNGNFNDDNFRSIYLHFTAGALAVSAGQIVEEGQYLGLGGSTGYSSSPHLHFEVQRSSDYFQTSYWPVDPYGWSGPGADPWPYSNVSLFRSAVQYKYFAYVPGIASFGPNCPGCGEVLQNNGFESGGANWAESGVDIIVSTSYPYLPIAPHSGNWLAWFGGRNNAVDAITQDFVLPMGTRSATLRYSFYISTDETGGSQDYFYVRLRTPDGAVIKELDFADNTYSDRGHWVQRQVFIPGLDAWGGQTLRLNFKGTTSADAVTNFYIDDVSLVAAGE